MSDDVSKSPPNQVIAGATVVVKNLELSGEEEFTLVGIRHVDHEEGKILVDSPLAQGLLGTKVGDKVKIKAPGGDLRFEVLSVRLPDN